MYEALLNGRPVLASRNLDPTKDYFCPLCFDKLVQKNGVYNASHFAHYPNSHCPRKGGGESAEHATLKVKFHDVLVADVARGEIADLRIEARFGQWISDLGFTTRTGKNVAVEITVKNLNFDHFREKMKAYRRMNVYPLWLFSPSVLKGKSRRPLTPAHMSAKLVTDSADWVELEDRYRPPRLMLYLHSFLGCGFLIRPDGVPIVIRIEKPEARPTNKRRRRLWRRVQLLSKCLYPLGLDLVISRYDGQNFPQPARTPLVTLIPRSCNCRRNFFPNAEGPVSARTRVLVSARTAIRFNFAAVENPGCKDTCDSQPANPSVYSIRTALGANGLPS